MGSNKNEKRKPKSAVYRSFWASVVYFHLRLISIKSHKREMTRNQFEGNLTRVRIPPAAPKEEETHSRLFLFVLHLLPLLPPEVDSQHDRGVNQRGGEDNEREVALHLVARRRETLDE